jgi:hypothetical protein
MTRQRSNWNIKIKYVHLGDLRCAPEEECYFVVFALGLI